MIYKQLGKSGLKVSVISLGSWMTFGQSVDDEITEACMKAAYDNGVNFFDGAEAYGGGAAENAMGRVLKNMGWSRDSYILSGKVSPNAGSGPAPTQKGLNRKHLVDCCNQTLQRFGVDYLDLFFCHRPDANTPLTETVFTMNDLIRQGKILYWGTSEFSPEDLMEMHAIARENGLVGPLMEQTGYNMLGRNRIDKVLVPLFEKYGMGSTIYSPLAGGILTGKYNNGLPEDSRYNTDTEWIKRGLTEEKIEKTRKLTAIADDLGISMAALALAWCIQNKYISTAIIGARKVDHVTQNVQACEAVEKLNEEILTNMEKILDNRPS